MRPVLGCSRQSGVSKRAYQRGPRNLQGLRAAVEEARDRAGTEDPGRERWSTWFTDNVVMATPWSGEVDDLEGVIGPTLSDVAYMQLLLLDHGFLARGGISFGPVYMDDTFVFGAGLISAYKTEQRAPRWPCVSLSGVTRDLCRAMAQEYYADPANSEFARSLLIDERGRAFVNHLQVWLDEEDRQAMVHHYLPRQRAVILEHLRTLPKDSNPWKKWRWLADYHDFALRQVDANRREYIVGRAAMHTFRTFGSTL